MAKLRAIYFLTSIFYRYNYYGQKSLYICSTSRKIIADHALFIYSATCAYHHSFWWYLNAELSKVLVTRQFQNLIYHYLAYLRRHLSIIEGKSFFLGSHLWEVLKQLWNFQVCYYKVRERFLEWEITKELHSSFANSILSFWRFHLHLQFSVYNFCKLFSTISCLSFVGYYKCFMYITVTLLP